MAVELPEPLQWVLLLLAGTRWPEADEDMLRDMAERWRNGAETLEDAGKSADSALKRALDGQEGEAAKALAKHWDQFTVGKGTESDPGYFPGLVQACNGMGDMLEAMANSAETAKIQIVAQLGILAFEIATAEAEAPFTAGVSLAQIPVAVGVSRTVVQQILKTLLKEALEFAAKQAAQMAAINVLAQGIEVMEGHRKSIDMKEVGQNALGGAVAGASGHLIGKGLSGAGSKLGLAGAMQTTTGKMVHGAAVGVGADVSTQLITTGHVEGGSLLGSGLSGGAAVGLKTGAANIKGRFNGPGNIPTPHGGPPPTGGAPEGGARIGGSSIGGSSVGGSSAGGSPTAGSSVGGSPAGAGGHGEGTPTFSKPDTSASAFHGPGTQAGTGTSGGAAHAGEGGGTPPGGSGPTGGSGTTKSGGTGGLVPFGSDRPAAPSSHGAGDSPGGGAQVRSAPDHSAPPADHGAPVQHQSPQASTGHTTATENTPHSAPAEHGTTRATEPAAVAQHTQPPSADSAAAHAAPAPHTGAEPRTVTEQPHTTPDSTARATPDSTARATPDSTARATPDSTARATPDSTARATPDSTPQHTEGGAGRAAAETRPAATEPQVHAGSEHVPSSAVHEAPAAQVHAGSEHVSGGASREGSVVPPVHSAGSEHVPSSAVHEAPAAQVHAGSEHVPSSAAHEAPAAQVHAPAGSAASAAPPVGHATGSGSAVPAGASVPHPSAAGDGGSVPREPDGGTSRLDTAGLGGLSVPTVRPTTGGDHSVRSVDPSTVPPPPPAEASTGTATPQGVPGAGGVHVPTQGVGTPSSVPHGSTTAPPPSTPASTSPNRGQGGLGPVHPSTSTPATAGNHGTGGGLNRPLSAQAADQIHQTQRDQRQAELDALRQNGGRINRAAQDLGRDQAFSTVRPPNADVLVRDVPTMSAQDRTAALAVLPPAQRRWIAKDPAFVDALKANLPPKEFARTAAQLMVDVDPRAERGASARAEAQAQAARMLQDPDVAATLLKNGAGLVVVPKDVSMTDVSAFHNMKGTTAGGASGAGRGWDDVRGSGGRRAAVTEENLLGEDTSIGNATHYQDGYSTTTHEFAHTIHMNGLSAPDRAAITTSYQNKRNDPNAVWSDGPRHDLQNNPVDNYASRDELEYFAQVSNAYLGTNHGTDPHTGQNRNNGPAWVRANEPALVPLLERLYGPDPVAVHHDPANPVEAVRAENDAYEGLRDFMDRVENPAPVPGTPQPATAGSHTPPAPLHPAPTNPAPTNPAPANPHAATAGSTHGQVPPPPTHDGIGPGPHATGFPLGPVSRSGNTAPADPAAQHAQAPPPPPPAPPVRTAPETTTHADVPPPPPAAVGNQTQASTSHDGHDTPATHETQTQGTHDTPTHDTPTHDTPTPDPSARDLSPDHGTTTPRSWNADRAPLTSPEDRAAQLRTDARFAGHSPDELLDLVHSARAGKADDLAQWVDRNGAEAVHALAKEIPEHALWAVGRQEPHTGDMLEAITERRGGKAPSPQEIDGRKQVYEKLGQYESVTVVVESGPGSGHQAAAVTLVRSLRELGYQGEIQMVAPRSVQARLERMLDTEELGVHEPVYVDKELDHDGNYAEPVRPDLGRGPTFVAASDSLDADSGSARALLSFTGADKAMLLTPYAWGHPRAVYERTVGEDGTSSYAAHHMDAGLSPNHGLYQFHIPTPETVAFPGDPELQAIADSVIDGKVDMMPVYGLARMDDRLRASGPEYLASAIRESGVHDVGGVRTYGKPAVMLEVGGREIGYAEQFEPGWLKRADLATADVPRLVSELQPGEVLLLRSGGTTQANFEKLFQLGNLPAIQEGANTTNASQLTGRPYLSPNVSTTPYPGIHEPAAADLLHARVANALGSDGAAALPDLARARDAWDEVSWRNPEPSREDYGKAAEELRNAAADVDRLAESQPEPVARTLRDAATRARDDAAVLTRSAEALQVNADLTRATEAMNAGTEWSDQAQLSHPHNQLGKIKWGREMLVEWRKEAAQHDGEDTFLMPVDKLQDFARAVVGSEDRTREPSAAELSTALETVHSILRTGLSTDDSAALERYLDTSTWEGEMVRTQVTPSTNLGRPEQVQQNLDALAAAIAKQETAYTAAVVAELGGTSNAPRPESVAVIAEVLRGYRTPESRFQAYTAEVNARALDWRQDQLLMGLLHMDDPHMLTDESVQAAAEAQLSERREVVAREVREREREERNRQTEERRRQAQELRQAQLEEARQARAAAAAAAAAEAEAAAAAQSGRTSDEESDGETFDIGTDDFSLF